MYSPNDRVYNTPDITARSAEKILQQIRLEKVLKRFGFFNHGCKYVPLDDSVGPPLVTLGSTRSTRGVPFSGAHEAFTGWQKSRNVQIPKPRQSTPSLNSSIQGAPIHCAISNDSYIKQRNRKLDRNKHGGVHFIRYDLKVDVQRPEMFKPFPPTRSTQKLPVIQRTRETECGVISQCLTNEFIQKQFETEMHSRQVKREKKLREREMKKKRKKITREMSFLKWHKYHDSNGNYDSLGCYSGELPNSLCQKSENSFRDRISAEIKKGVQQRIGQYGPGLQLLKRTRKSSVNVLNMKFSH